ncbi:MAG: aspartate-semialdehyde dehydrogenase [Deltaproteobacteria bacterium]|nr:aspartate-semialdehyde dehydrogenase [Deltaproteobacteria bacterium]
MGFTVAVVGATGAVGREMLRTLEKRSFPVDEIVCLASTRSAGSTITFRGQEVLVRATSPEAFKGVQIALFSAGASVAREMGPAAAAAGAVVIDNSSAWRQDAQCPLVVPEVNPHAIKDRPRGIIANPNCSTIQMLVALEPLHKAAQLRHIIVSTYQATSGKGHAAVEDLKAQTAALARGEAVHPTVFPGQIAQNLLCDWKPSAMEGGEGYSEEETKMVFETHKIMGDPTIGVSPTCVRVPVVNGHSESVWARFARPISVEEAKELLRNAPGLILDDRPYAPGAHPQPVQASGRDEVLVGRVRRDFVDPNALNLWVVGDNLLKGAALNAVQIAERVIAE